MAKKVIRLTEADIENIVRNIILEQQNQYRERSITSEDMNRGDTPEKIEAKQQNVNRALKGVGRYEGYTVDETFTPLNIGIYVGGGPLSLRKGGKDKVITFVESGLYKAKLEKVNELVRYMDDESKQEFENLKSDNPTFYGYMLSGDRVASLVSILNNSTKKSKSCIVYSTGTQKELIPAENPEMELPVYDVKDDKTSYNKKFVSGSAEIDPRYAEAYKDDLLNQFNEATNQMRNAYKDDTTVSFPGVIFIKGIEIISSSSKVSQDNMSNPRYNTKTNDEGYQNLADDRANSMKELIEGIISSNDKIAMVPGADIRIDSRAAQGPEWEPSKGKDHPDYQKHQKALIQIKFQVPGEIEPDPKRKLPKLTTEDGFAVVVTGQRRKDFGSSSFRRFNLGGNGGFFKKIASGMSSLLPRAVEKCPPLNSVGSFK
jgi:hypothetical protein